MEENYYQILIFSIFFVLMTGLTVLINSILLKFSTNLGSRNDENGLNRWSSTSKPALGGISFFILFLLSMVFDFGLNHIETPLYNKELLCFIVIMVLGFVMGLSDDAYNTKPLLKFSVQFLCGILFIYSGNYIKIFPVEGLNYFFTLLWVVGLMNSINMLDNMDGVTTSVSASILIGAIIFMIIEKQVNSIYFIVTVGVLASLIGFFYHNWYPSKMFMGDTGSQFLGVFLAWIGVMFFWNGIDVNHEPVQTKQILTAVLIFVAPIADTLTVSINRIKSGKSPFVGGRDHTTHHLVYNGFNERQVALIFGFITLTSVLLVLNFIYFVQDWTVTLSIIWGAYFLIIIALLYATTLTKKAKMHHGK